MKLEGLREGEGAEQRREDPELCRRAEQRRLRVREERAEVGHRADAHEDQQGEQAVATPEW